jgi:O-antigen ligase
LILIFLRGSALKSEKLWAYAIVFLWLSQVLAGPIISVLPSYEYVLPLLGLSMLAVALLRLRNGLPSKSALWASMILVGAVAISALQLVPLPPSIWTNFAGREFVVSTLATIGQKPGWMPLSLAPNETISYLIYSVPAIAIFFASLSLEPHSRRPVILGIVAIAIISSLLGLAQKAGQSAHFLQLFKEVGGMGFFANRNFHGALLFTSIPIIAAVSMTEISRKTVHISIVALFSVAFLAIILIGIGSTTSRSAVILAMAAVFLTALMLWRREIQDERKMHFTFKFVAFALILLAVAQFSLAGISRLAESDKLDSGRAIMAATSIEALKQVFPFGSGFGSFVPFYAMHETPDNMLSGYVNHAHNDWIELALEGGAPMMLILAAFLVWFVGASFKAWHERAEGLGGFSLRASAIVILLLLLHSLSDYPLRTRALMALFAICCGFLAYGPEQKIKRHARKHKPTPPDAFSAAPEQQPYGGKERTKGAYFVRKVPQTDNSNSA